MKLYNDWVLKFQKPDWSRNLEFGVIDTSNKYHCSPFSILIFFAVFIIAGVALVPLIPVQLKPDYTLPTVSVRYAWNGAQPRAIEQEVTSPLEGLFATMRGIKNVKSESGIGSGQISIEFDKNTDMDLARFEVAASVRRIYQQLPPGVSYPQVVAGGRQYQAYKTWKDASDVYNVSAYPECLEDFELAYPQLKTNGAFLVQYGKALEMAGKHENSIAILNEAKPHLNNTVLYTCLSNNYKVLAKNTEAEQAYLRAFNMAPARFYPLYLLAKLYDETGQSEKANAMAKKVMDKEVKIESTAIKEIQEEMRKIVEKGDAETLNKNDIQTAKARSGTKYRSGAAETSKTGLIITRNITLQR
jgi:hypothetical protein